MTEKKQKMSFGEAEAVFEELLRTGAGEALRTIRRLAYERRISPVQAIVDDGDPREDKP